MKRVLLRVETVLLRALAAMRRRVSKPRPQTQMAVTVTGPGWLASMLGPSSTPRGRPAITVVGPGHEGSAGSRQRVVFYRSDGTPRFDAPFVQPHLSNPLRLKVPEGLPEDMTSLARQAARLVSGPDSEKATHERYRSAHTLSAAGLLAEMAAASGASPGPAPPQVTMVCVSNRPERLSDVVANYLRQSYDNRRLLLILNTDRHDRDLVDQALSEVPGASWMETPVEMTLGECLNAGLERIETRYMAKVDDDDIYGENYLTDMMIAHAFARAGVVGKHSYYARLVDQDQLLLRFPGHELVYTSFVAGGTLVIDTEQTAAVRFPHVTIGEDQGFLRSCLRRGISVFSADRFNYVQNRHSDNTWSAAAAQFSRQSVLLDSPDPGLPFA